MIKLLTTEQEIEQFLKGIKGEDNKDQRKEWYKTLCLTLYGDNKGDSSRTTILHPEDVFIILNNPNIRDAVMSELIGNNNISNLLNWWDRNSEALKSMDNRRKSVALTFMSAALFVQKEFKQALKTARLAMKYSVEWKEPIANDSMLNMIQKGLSIAIQFNDEAKLHAAFIDGLLKCSSNIDSTLLGPKNLIDGPKDLFDKLPSMYEQYLPDVDTTEPAVLLFALDDVQQATLHLIDPEQDCSAQYLPIIEEVGVNNIVILANNYTKEAIDLDKIFKKEEVDWRSDFREVMWANNGRAGSLMCEDEICCPSEGFEISGL